MNPLEIIQKHYDKNSELYHILITHSKQVESKAIQVAKQHPELNIDLDFISEASLLHDIGIFLTNAPSIACVGTHSYIEHGYLGADILRAEGYPRHALVCERHTGIGLSLDYIIAKNLPLPHRDMRPISIEEQLVCYADKFFSKSNLNTIIPIDVIISNLNKFDSSNGKQFLHWHKLFQ